MTSGAPVALNLVGGRWVEPLGGEQIPVEDPATRETLGTVPISGAEDVARAVAAAKDAFPAWRRTPPIERARVLFRLKLMLDDARQDMAVQLSQGAREERARDGGGDPARYRERRTCLRYPHPHDGRHAGRRGTRHRLRDDSAAAGCVRHYHALQLPRDDPHVVLALCRRHWEHGSPEAERARSADSPAGHRVGGGGRSPSRCAQYRARP